MGDAPRDPNEIMSFATFLQNLQDGGLHAELSTELANAVAEMNNARLDGQAKPKVKIVVTVDMTLDGQTVDVNADYSVKMPRTTRERSVFWTTPRNTLTRSNPKQHDLPFGPRTIHDEHGEVRTVESSAGPTRTA